jgi:tRNA(Ile)-lysidine synthase
MTEGLKTEHLVLRTLAGVAGSGERWLLAVSGGVDSLVMAEVLYRWRRHFKVSLAVAHVHHGRGPSASQNRFRARAQKRVQAWAQEKGLEFFTNSSETQTAVSEGELREFRRGQLRGWFRQGEFDRIVMAHHLDDLLETRMLRLLRGVGPQGLKAMSAVRGKILRPLIEVSRREIEIYANSRKIKWVEDPSNTSSEVSLRNWLRHTWLPQLERRSPGALSSLSRSLTTLASDKFTETIGPFVGLRRVSLGEADPTRRAAIVARYLRSIGIKGYSRTHVEEVLKRLANRTPHTQFDMLGFSFQTTPDFLWASRV